MLSEILKEDCFMLDIESTGLSPITNGMTSFALVKFDMNKHQFEDCIIGFAQYRINSSINVDMYRVNDPDTSKFRADNHIGEYEQTLTRLDSLMEIPEKIDSLVSPFHPNHRHIFALHTEFDIAFLRGYFEAAQYDFSFKHRNIWELASLIKGMNQDLKEIRDNELVNELLRAVECKFMLENFQPHNALYDCIRQIAFLWIALDQTGF